MINPGGYLETMVKRGEARSNERVIDPEDARSAALSEQPFRDEAAKANEDFDNNPENSDALIKKFDLTKEAVSAGERTLANIRIAKETEKGRINNIEVAREGVVYEETARNLGIAPELAKAVYEEVLKNLKKVGLAGENAIAMEAIAVEKGRIYNPDIARMGAKYENLARNLEMNPEQVKSVGEKAIRVEEKEIQKGRILDSELAQVGAIHENKARDSGETPDLADYIGEKAIEREKKERGITE